MLLFGLWPIASPFPIVGLASMVLDGEYEDSLAAGAVNDVEWKARHSTFAFNASGWRPDVGHLSKVRTNLFNNTQESEAEAWAALFIEPRRLNHLVGCDAMKINLLHRSASRAR
jgi:hypothetical protein